MMHSIFVRLGLVTLICVVLVGCPINNIKPSSSESERLRGERFLHGTPSGWLLAFSATNENSRIKEYVPVGQSVENWEEMITTQVFFGGIGKSLKQLVRDMREVGRKRCPAQKTFAEKSGKENGYEFVFFQRFCGNNIRTNKPEITFFKIIQGNDSLYMIHKAWKSAPTKEEIATWTGFLMGARVCDSRIAERRCQDVILE